MAIKPVLGDFKKQPAIRLPGNESGFYTSLTCQKGKSWQRNAFLVILLRRLVMPLAYSQSVILLYFDRKQTQHRLGCSSAQVMASTPLLGSTLAEFESMVALLPMHLLL